MGLVDDLPGMAYRCRNDRHWTMEFVSAGAERLTGYTAEELTGNRRLSFADLVHEKDRDRVRTEVQEAIDRRERFQLEYRIRTASGKEKWVWEEGRSITVETDDSVVLEGFITDVTKRRQLEERLHQVERLEAIGRLAGGIAHDFNNMLTAVLGLSDLVLSELGEEHPCHGDVREIHDTCERSVSLTRQLLAFARHQILQPEVIELNLVVGETEKLLQRVIAADVELEVSLGPIDRPVELDPSQLERVLLNLAVNARDAMPDGGKLTIETSAVELDSEFALMRPHVEPGPYVLITVTDTGCGIPPELQDKIFEPFFTTKPRGEGTGLGLSTVYGIVKQSGGFVWLYSEVGTGTTVKIYFPVIADARMPARKDPRPESVPTETGRVLLVEDTKAVREVTARILQSGGYEVLVAATPEAAREHLKAYPGGIDLLISDIMLPGISGTELVEEVLAESPSMRVLFISGYTERAALRQEVLPPGASFVAKPFTPSALLARVREAMQPEPESVP